MKTEWISVKDELPPRGVWVLFYSWRGVLMGSFWTDYWITHEISTHGLMMNKDYVSHWMYLPPPPTQ